MAELLGFKVYIHHLSYLTRAALSPYPVSTSGGTGMGHAMVAIYEASLPFIVEPIAIADTFATSLTIERCYSNLRITHYCDRQTSPNNPIIERVIVARIVIPISECKHACTQLYDALLHSGLLAN